MAKLYRRWGCLTLSREERIAVIKRRLDELQLLRKSLLENHKANCEACQKGEFCLENFVWRPENHVHDEEIDALSAALYSEERDAEYARKAAIKNVCYKHHIDGFCAYWQNVRHRRFEFADWKCERCGRNVPLIAHHVNYDHLGFEEIKDLEALCEGCHATRHGAAA
jgi:hypothetical protein